tara:strand:+ start:32 stop:622 length:591 start_codon:yes stop_codon:yes gene_type:complete
MPSSPNVPRLKKMLEGFTMPSVTATTVTATSGTCNTQLTTLSSSFTGPATVTGTGLETCQFTATTDIPVGTGDTSFPTLTIPAGAMITDMGFQFVTQCTLDSTSTVSVKVGSAASGSQWISAKQLSTAGENIPVGTVASVALGTKVQSGGTALAFVDGQFLHVTTSDTVHATATVGTADLTSGGSGRFYVKYTILK